ncbi:hypothetical protein CPB83DRAFT_850161 [Crepidotus variabilis]|uniref:Uncharacterized protein n=1 Tax=Crepidotus variabilis TaxID=179855 RepID=A0A9P6JSN0_9AGAR|nr:hypothetical protein CPB83DRAFT_850161 [Crepidotus variabilis]
MPPLPLEILDLFVDSIEDSQVGKKALCACMLVCKPFFVRARSRVFSRVELGLKYNSRALLKLLEYQAAGYPALGPRIKALKVCWDPEFLEEDSSFAEENKEKIGVLFSLSHPTCKVTNLELAFSLGDLSRLEPSQQAYRAMRAICSTSTLRKLGILFASNFPVEIFNIFQLTDLHMYMADFSIPLHSHSDSTSVSTTSSINPHPQVIVSRLRNFTLRFPEGITDPPEWRQPLTSPFSSLHSLLVELSNSTENSPDLSFNALLSTTQATLKNLVIYLHAGFFQNYCTSLLL